MPVLRDRRQGSPGDPALRGRRGPRDPRHRPASADPHPAHLAPAHPVCPGSHRRRWPAARSHVRGGRRSRPVGGDRRRRLSTGLQCRPLGWPVGRPPAPPPDGRPGVRMAARVKEARFRKQAAAAIVAVSALAACSPGGGPTLATFPAGTIGPTRTAGPAAAETRLELVRVLGERNLVLRDTDAPFRPPEDVTFTTTPRAVYQVVLPDAPTEGFIVVYEFPDATAAA